MIALPRRVEQSLWWIYLACGGGVCLLYWLAPNLPAHDFFVPVVGFSATAAIIFGAVHYRPAAWPAWVLFAIGQFIFVDGRCLHLRVPPDVEFPSLGDAIYLSLYPALFGGIFVLARRRNPNGEWASLIDSLILTIGLGLISWLVLVSPVIHDDSQSTVAQLVSVAYPIADILLLAFALRLAVDTGKRQPALYLLFGSIATLLVTDFIYGVMLNNGTWNGQVSLDIGWMSYYLLWGAAALHPSMRTLEEPVPEKEATLSWTRLGILTVASLIAPGLQVLVRRPRRRHRRAGDDHRPIGLFLLVVARMAVLVRQQEHSVERSGRARGRRGAGGCDRPRRHRRGCAVGTRSLAGTSYSARLCLLQGHQLELVGVALNGGTMLSRSTTQRLLLAASIGGAATCPTTSTPSCCCRSGRGRPRAAAGGARRTARSAVAAGPVALSTSQQAGLQSLATSVSLALEQPR